MNIFSIYVRSPVCVRSVRESARGARLTHVCIRGVKGAISTALTSVVGYGDPPEGRPKSVTLIFMIISKLNMDRGVVIVCNCLLNRPFRKSYYLLIGEQTRTRAHSRRNSAAVFHLNNSKSSFSRCLRMSLQSCQARFFFQSAS